ncbi:MAG: hypothetical protein ABI633_13970 [Burkholderiales bacterium]
MRIGIVGIGSMGFTCGERLRKRGWPLAVRDIDLRRLTSTAGVANVNC